MKWLVVLVSLFVHTQVSAVGLCKPTADDEGMSNKCIGGWNGATKSLAYVGALTAMLEKLQVVIIYDSYAHSKYDFGHLCEVSAGNPDVDPPIPARGCLNHMPQQSDINTSLASAFHRTLDTSQALFKKLEGVVTAQIYYEIGSSNNPEIRDQISACQTRSIHKKIAGYWNNFADNFQRDYDAYQDKYRKKIFKHYFQAIKRLYGIYANRMKKLMRKVKREYDCTD